MKILLLVLLTAWGGCKEIKATEIVNRAPIGAHYPILTFEKSENPQNIMMIYTKLDKDCRFELNSQKKNEPVFDFYWLMGKKTYKPVHPLIKSGIHDRLQVETGEAFIKDRTEFEIKVNDLKGLKTDLKEARLKVFAKKIGGKCEVQADIQLGPTDKNATLQIDTIYSETRKTFIPPFRKVNSITLIGTDEASGKAMKRTYSKN
jgi:hypothetical protein